MLYVGLKHPEIDFGGPDPTGKLTPTPYSWWGGQLAAPPPKKPNRRLGPSGIELFRGSSLLTTFRRPWLSLCELS